MTRVSGRSKVLSTAIIGAFLCTLLATFPVAFPNLTNAGIQTVAPQVLSQDHSSGSPAAASTNLNTPYFLQYLNQTAGQIASKAQNTNTTFGLNGTYYNLFNANWSTVIGSSVLSSYDTLLYNTGILGLQNPESVIPMLTATMLNTPLYDQTQGAFRQNITQDGTVTTNAFTLIDNALALDNLLSYASSNPTIVPICQNLWNYLNATLQTTVYNFNNPNHVSGLSFTEFLPVNGSQPSSDNINLTLNFLGALVNSMASRYPSILGPSVASAAGLLAQNAFIPATYQLVDPTGLVTYTTASNAPNSTALAFKDGNQVDNFSLKTNSLGIATLADFYLASEASGQPNQTALTMAKEVYSFVVSNLYNSSSSLTGFVDQIQSNYNLPTTNRISLESNAYWLMALGRLFEATGDLTYYREAITVYNQTVANLWDPTNLGFNQSISFFGNDSSKSVGDNSLFFLALNLLNQAYASTQLTLNLPQSTLTAFQDTTLNLTCQYNMVWTRSYPDIALNYTINQPINVSSVTFNFRYPNETLFMQAQNITDVNGFSGATCVLPAVLPLGTYTVSTYANYTGFATAYNSASFTVISGLNATAFPTTAIPIIQGETTTFNVSIASARNQSIFVSLAGIANNCTIASPNFIIGNGTTTSQAINLTSDADAPVGIQNAVLSFYNQSVDLLDIVVPITVTAAVTLIHVTYPQNIISDVPGVVTATLQNMRAITTETVTILLQGTDIQSAIQTVNIAAGNITQVNLEILGTNLLPGVSTNFTVTITRLSQIISTNNYSIQVVSAIEILGLQTASQVPQGAPLQISIQATNNLNTTQLIDIYVDGQIWQSNIQLLPGFNNINLQGEQPFTLNPYDLSTHEINITVTTQGGSILSMSVLPVQSTLTVGNALLFYLLFVLIPVALVVISYQRKKKRELLR